MDHRTVSAIRGADSQVDHLTPGTGRRAAASRCRLSALERDQQHIFLFEVIDGDGQNINSEGDLFEVTFESAPGFAAPPSQQLHLILTNPPELSVALERRWALAQEIVAAIRNDDYQKLYADEVGERLLDKLREKARVLERAHG